MEDPLLFFRNRLPNRPIHITPSLFRRGIALAQAHGITPKEARVTFRLLLQQMTAECSQQEEDKGSVVPHG
ncbi:MAG: hypothetical protein A3E07_01485 [Candidatus Wildermuthbacteria bacterium RIFCSPHIGHO2_12_FULL_45_9]|uniref:Uncharacterized protein n=1 Tax=Candidatus Wildermuthbacteria bacterium RIFCSPHIGHO2_02_FULL_45_25 TaxID=1802450 RepID=A0A1G2R2W0_9BACT|nr:MAG: hypothetical protein A2748_01990 [Candidatus Wildermuthbacteria bacterium RIFCSPHIGHO2_01_FULL_45_20]OHA67180.1 MAG: hypothetical protein A3C04_02635 [Candidatus Wildermuthbacteria bacterium RIFCSPHIGHO2_02_FULL_45_25]OHA71339.1 MAG: hypothetical protein A3E07_01485 [Candidatus Wildermuthbacteria bacterium RIFCSPHIGHO2_12_FULL_45_9]